MCAEALGWSGAIRGIDKSGNNVDHSQLQRLQQISFVATPLDLLSMLKIMLILLDDKLNAAYLYYYNASHTQIEFSYLAFLQF